MKSNKNQKSSIKMGKKPTMKFSQEQVDDTIIPKVDIFNMSKKSTKSESLPISDGLIMYLHGAGDSGERYVRVDFNDYSTYKDFYMIMDRTTLKGVADFIYKYLENK